jgi:GTP-binding protein
VTQSAKLNVIESTFVTTGTAPAHYPSTEFPEVAFVGRSNVGKSSLINALCQRKALVRVSNTPGRTRALNFFDVVTVRNKKKRTLRFCDLPGYGYAKVSKTERESWRSMIETYLTKRKNLKVVVAIVDGEIGATGDDAAMIDFLQSTQVRILVVATKIDRLAKAKRKPQLQRLQSELQLPEGAMLGISSTERLGLEEVWQRLLDVVSTSAVSDSV